MANIRWAATVALLQAEAGMTNGEAAVLAGYFSVGDGGGGPVWFSTTVPTKRTVSAATNATPIEITTSANHGLATGQRVMIAGVSGTHVRFAGKVSQIDRLSGGVRADLRRTGAA